MPLFRRLKRTRGVDFIYHTVQALTLREVNYKESDKILTLLATELGKVTASARGCRKKGSQLAAPIQLLCWSEMVLYDYKGRWLVKEASIVRQFQGITRDLDRMALACYCAEVVELMAVEGLPSGEILQLILNTLHVLDKQQEKSLPLVKAVFELRLMALSGYEPMLDSCAVCGETMTDSQFHLREGVVHCPACRSQLGAGVSLPLTQGTLSAMRHICLGDERRLFSFALDEVSQTCLAGVAEGYLLSQLERGFHTLDFYKSLAMPSIK